MSPAVGAFELLRSLCSACDLCTLTPDPRCLLQVWSGTLRFAHLPSYHLPPVSPRQVESDHNGCSRFRHDRPVQALPVMVRAHGAREFLLRQLHLRVDRLPGILVQDDLEGLELVVRHDHLRLENLVARCSHGHRATVVPTTADIVSLALHSAHAAEGSHALRAGVRRHSDVTIPNLQLDRHSLSSLANEAEVLTLSKEIGPAHRHVSIHGPVLRWVDDFRLDTVTQEVELLVAVKSKLHLGLEEAGLRANHWLHMHGLEAIPRGDHRVTVLPRVHSSLPQSPPIFGDLP
mmetsp:Transcript_49981/g.107129  ORF Transcript_49981/g.107129 Transcript_49981/m.107129 type:complete len:290 (+) Transcript_49981:96-965(+)